MTGVEWLISELKKYDRAGLKDQSNYVIEMPTHILTELEEQAKEMEKQQITDGYSEGKTNGMDISHPLSLTKEISAEQYYNETFNK